MLLFALFATSLIALGFAIWAIWLAWRMLDAVKADRVELFKLDCQVNNALAKFALIAELADEMNRARESARARGARCFPLLPEAPIVRVHRAGPGPL